MKNHETHEMTRKKRRASVAPVSVHGGATVPVAVVDATATGKAASETLAPPKKTAIRWVTAPQSSLPGAPAVQGVMLAANEDVQWSWTHTTNGSYVNGYSIVRRTAPQRVILSAAKNLSRSNRARRSVAG
jgi:hypothetical protein